MLQSIVGTVVCDYVAAVFVVDYIVGFEHIDMVSDLEGFDFVFEEIFCNLIINVFELYDFDCDFWIIGSVKT